MVRIKTPAADDSDGIDPGGAFRRHDRRQLHQNVGGPVTAARTPATQTYELLVYRSSVTDGTNSTSQLGWLWGKAPRCSIGSPPR